MFEIRARDSTTAFLHQNRLMIEIKASGDNIPLTNENWFNRWCTVPEQFQNIYEQIYNFEVKDDDVFVVTFPKCGTTWIQEAAWLLMNSLEFDKAKSEDLSYRSPFIDLTALYNEISANTVYLADKSPSPRLIKTHLPACLLPKQIWQKHVKIIYCARNLKDVVVSYGHFKNGLGTFRAGIPEFVDDFINDDVEYTPFWPHILDFWQMRNEPNIFFTTYEAMKRDLSSVLERLCDFLGHPVLSSQDMSKMLEHLSFENMKDNRRANPTQSIKTGHGSPYVKPDFEFMRRGIVGSYKDDLTEADQLKLDQWTHKCLQDKNVSAEQIFGDI